MSSVLVCLLAVISQVEADPFAPSPEERPRAAVEPEADARPEPQERAEEVAQREAVPPGSPPILRLNPNGPHARTASIAFAPDGKTLYAAGNDKVVHVWRLGQTHDDAYHDRAAHFVPDARRTLRLPVGPGLWGTINAMALSDDGRWLAAGGWGWAEGSGAAGFRDTGFIWPETALFPETLEDLGTVFVFDTTTGEARRLRGHRGPVIGVTFTEGDSPAVVSIALEQLSGGRVQGVVRAWDPALGDEIGRTSVPKEPGERFAPSLAAWRLTNGTVRTAFTWSDGWVRIWDVGQKPRGHQAGLSLTCVRRPGTEEILFGEFVGGVNRLNRRHLPADPAGWRLTGRPLVFGAEAAPVAAAFLSDGSTLALAVAESTSAGPKYQLELRRLADGQRVGARVPLAIAATPALAASSQGDVAVASEPDGTVLLFKTESLIRGRAEPSERLRGTGDDLAGVSWVRQGERIGLRIAARAGAERVLPLDTGNAEPASGEWRPDLGEAGGWRVQRSVEATRTVLRISGPGGAAARAVVPERCEVTAVCAKVPGIEVPILAAASAGGDDPGWLYLYDARTGQQLRKLTGHTGRVTSLSFAGDGRLLVSAAADRTVNAWWLGDLDALIGKRGLLRGVQVASVEAGLRVSELGDEATEAVRRALPVGAVIRGALDQESVRAFETPGEFYQHVSGLAPNSRLTLRTDRGDVAVAVGQAIDERKPLFSLLVEQDAASRRFSWIGWSPLGPFESSDRVIERLVGWHFNPTEPGAEVHFADLGEYRETFFGRGLLEALARTGRIPEDWPPARPKVSALFRDAAGTPRLPDSASRLATEVLPSELIVEVSGMPADRVDAVSFRIDDGEVRPLAGSATLRGSWTADLSDLTLGAGEHVVTITAAGIGFEPVSTQVVVELAQAVAARPQVLPRVSLRAPRNGAVVYGSPGEESGSVAMEASVPPWTGPGALEVEILVNGQAVELDGAPVGGRIEPAEQAQTMRVEVPVRPGENRIAARLVNQAGEKGPEQAVGVRFLRPPVFASIAAPAESDQATVALVAEIESATEPVRESLRLSVNGVRATAGEVALERREGGWRLGIEGVPLSARVNDISLELANADGFARKAGTARIVRVSAAPRPVSVDLAGLGSGSTVTKREFTLRSVVRSPARLVRTEVFINGRALSEELPEPEASGEYLVGVTIRLEPGINTIRVVATNAEGGVGEAAATVSLVEPPVTIEIDRVIAAGGKEFEPGPRGDGSLSIDGALPTDTGTLRGRIAWSEAAGRPAGDHLYLHVWVNGFFQSGRRLALQGDAAELSFEVPVALNRQTGNRVRLELPALAEAESGRRELVLDCSDPEAKQRIHLLLAGVAMEPEEGKRLTKEVVESLATGEAAGDRVIVYEPLVGEVYSGDVFAHLQLFRHRPPDPDAPHDVLLLYFRGQEAAKRDGNFVLVTSDSSTDPASDEFAVTSDRLSDLLGDTRGAHLLFLDVAGSSRSQAETWPRDTNLGVLRSVWLGDGAMPAQFSVWQDLRRASEADRRLGHIAAALGEIRARAGRVVFDPHVPADLADLVLVEGGG